jgi:hypothetical protein
MSPSTPRTSAWVTPSAPRGHLRGEPLEHRGGRVDPHHRDERRDGQRQPPGAHPELEHRATARFGHQRGHGVGHRVGIGDALVPIVVDVGEAVAVGGSVVALHRPSLPPSPPEAMASDARILPPWPDPRLHHHRRPARSGVGRGPPHRAPRRLDGRRRGHPLHLLLTLRRGHHVRLRDEGRPHPPDRRDGGHRVGRRQGDGRAPRGPRHRNRPVHPHQGPRRARPASRGPSASSSRGGWAGPSAGSWVAASCAASGSATCSCSPTSWSAVARTPDGQKPPRCRHSPTARAAASKASSHASVSPSGPREGIASSRS